MTTNPRTKIQPILVEVSLHNAISRRLREHGVPEFDSIANEVTLELTGKHIVNPPTGVPHTFTIDGVQLTWPQGLDTRVPTTAECEPFNRALTGVSNDRMSTEDNVRVLRTCYQALWKRVCIQANERVEQMASVPEPTAPVVTTSMLKGTNPVLEASVGDDGAVTIKPKRKSTRKPKVESTQQTLDTLEVDQPGTVEWAYAQTKVQPVVSTESTLTSLQDDLTNLRKTLEGAEG